MKTFRCQCGNRLFFLNSRCLRCNRELGYLPERFQMGALEPADGLWAIAGDPEPRPRYRKCNNYAIENVCNWMVPETDPDPFCRACRLNEVIPDLSQPGHRKYWYNIESAKRRMLYSLFKLRLPVVGRKQDPANGLAFTFLADKTAETEFTDPIHGQAAVMTGHRRGLITINLAEADDVARTRMRERMQERYRTLLGHFRHEIGHYFWDRLVRDHRTRLAAFRERFGDERHDYKAALERHYAQGPPAGWEQRYISSYASMHPWEDWAESWAHYLHMVSTLETAHDFGLVPAGRSEDNGDDRGAEFNPAHERFGELLERWVQLTVALNAISRSMGLPDAYPFVLSKGAEAKLGVIHRLIAEVSRAASPA